VDIHARVTSKGQVTIPKPVRDALNLEQGDAVLFRVEGSHATIARSDDFIAMAGCVSVPPSVRGMAWADVLKRADRDRGDA
jgi:AbrB family looped-hinge helix DNA binding protein